MVEHVTSYDDPDVGEGAVRNDVLREYDTIGRPAKEYQEHNGAKDGNTLYVENAYESLATALRATSVRYPNGRNVYFDYSGTHDGYLNRLTAIKDADNSTTLSQYAYLGSARWWPRILRSRTCGWTTAPTPAAHTPASTTSAEWSSSFGAITARAKTATSSLTATAVRAIARIANTSCPPARTNTTRTMKSTG